MKKYFIIGGACIAFILTIVFIVMGVNNRAITYEETIGQTSSDIRVEEKRRFDLIPNLVDAVKQYDKHEYETLKGVIESRKGVTAENIEDVKAMIAAVAEAYPDLKAQKNYQELMNELAITENKIAQMRKYYNKSVTEYKRFVRQFPNRQILGLGGYEVKDYERLEFENTSVDAPKLNFE